MRIVERGEIAILRTDFYRTFPSKEEAERYGALLHEAIADATRRYSAGGKASLCLNAETIEEYFFYVSALKCWRAETTRARRAMLHVWVRLLPAVPLSAITARDMAAAIRALRGVRGNKRRYGLDMPGLSADTVNKYIDALRSFVTWAREDMHSIPDHLELESVKKIRISGKLRGNRFPPRVHVQHQFFNILKRLNKVAPYIADVFYGMLLFGRRPAQLFRLQWQDVHMPTKASLGSVDFGPCKGGCESSPSVEYGSQKHKLLLRCMEFWQKVYSRRDGRKTPPPDEFVFCTRHGASVRGRGWTTSIFDQELARRCKALGIRDFKGYDARRSVITWLQNTPGISPAAIQAFAGWLRITTQEAYGKRTPADALPALAAMEKMARLPKQSGSAPESGMAEDTAGLFDDID